MENILEMILTNGFTIAALAGIVSTILGVLLRKYVTPAKIVVWGNSIFFLFEKIGIAVTLGLSKWKITKGFWNSVIEPTVIILLGMFLRNMLDGLVEGMKSDNESFK